MPGTIAAGGDVNGRGVGHGGFPGWRCGIAPSYRTIGDSRRLPCERGHTRAEPPRAPDRRFGAHERISSRSPWSGRFRRRLALFLPPRNGVGEGEGEGVRHVRGGNAAALHVGLGLEHQRVGGIVGVHRCRQLGRQQLVPRQRRRAAATPAPRATSRFACCRRGAPAPPRSALPPKLTPITWRKPSWCNRSTTPPPTPPSSTKTASGFQMLIRSATLAASAMVSRPA